VVANCGSLTSLALEESDRHKEVESCILCSHSDLTSAGIDFPAIDIEWMIQDPFND
jgi:hypothetical protein